MLLASIQVHLLGVSLDLSVLVNLEKKKHFCLHTPSTFLYYRMHGITVYSGQFYPEIWTLPYQTNTLILGHYLGKR